MKEMLFGALAEAPNSSPVQKPRIPSGSNGRKDYGKATSFSAALNNSTQVKRNDSKPAAGIPVIYQAIGWTVEGKAGGEAEVATGSPGQHTDSGINVIQLPIMPEMLFGLRVHGSALQGTPGSQEQPQIVADEDGSFSDLFQKLVEILQALGFSVNNEMPGSGRPMEDGETETGGGSGLTPGQNHRTSEIDKILAVMQGNGTLLTHNLRHGLEHLLKQLYKFAELSPELSELKALLEFQLQEGAGSYSDDEFIKKLADVLMKVAESRNRPNAPNPHADAAAQNRPANHVPANGRVHSAVQEPVSVQGPTVQGQTALQLTPANSKETGQSLQNSGDNNANTAPTLVGGQDNSTGLNQETKFGDIKPAQPAQVRSEPMTQNTRPAFEILGQIVQKAKIIVTTGITKVQIQLKPEHMGKLILSVSTENGLVTARFNAETHQVKGIIESNLNALRDALTEQGIKVDQLTVSVGPEKDFSGFRERAAGFRKNNSTKGPRAAADQNILDRLMPAAIESAGVSVYYGSTVDFTV